MRALSRTPIEQLLMLAVLHLDILTRHRLLGLRYIGVQPVGGGQPMRPDEEDRCEAPMRKRKLGTSDIAFLAFFSTHWTVVCMYGYIYVRISLSNCVNVACGSWCSVPMDRP